MARETRASIEAENRIYAKERLIKEIQAPLLAKISKLEKRIEALQRRQRIGEQKRD